MREANTHDEMEKALLRLIPADLSGPAKAEMEAQLDELSGYGMGFRHTFLRWGKWYGGMAAAFVIGIFAFSFGSRQTAPLVGIPEDNGMTLIQEVDRVGEVSDEGLYVDAGGSAVRKMSVWVDGETKMLDEETGIEVTLTEPRREMYLLPVSTF